MMMPLVVVEDGTTVVMEISVVVDVGVSTGLVVEGDGSVVVVLEGAVEAAELGAVVPVCRA
ncbi:MAG: hypothetical protein M3163_03480 [Actinomycetota bacterium]|nr:hypothetical protein [Actinomycetota bacterium]